MKSFLLMCLLGCIAIEAHANEDAFNQTLVRIINQLNAINPLINEALQSQPKNARIQLHLEQFEGADNQKHNGLREDLSAIKKALIAYLNKPAIAPRAIKPLALDYIDSDKGAAHG